MKSVPWQATAEQFRSILRQLRFRYHKWDTHACGSLKLVPESILLTQREHEQLVELAEGIAAVLARLESLFRQDARRIESLGIPRELVPMIQSERASDLQLARYDLFPTTDGGWAVSEFNEDVPGGFNEVIACPELLSDCHPRATVPGDFARAFLEAVPADEAVALMYATGYSEDLQHMLILAKLLHERGQETVLCSPSHLTQRRGRAEAERRRLGAIVRFYPGEWFPLLPNRKQWQRLLPQLTMLNPLSRLIRQSKRLFTAWNEPGLLPPEDRALLDRVAPASLPFHASQTGMLRAERDAWVLKQAFGRMGDSVVMGSLVTGPQWDEALSEAERSPAQYLIQRQFHVRPLEFTHGSLYPALGVFLINGRFAGYYSRVAPIPFLTHEAYYVPTVVDAACAVGVDRPLPRPAADAVQVPHGGR